MEGERYSQRKLITKLIPGSVLTMRARSSFNARIDQPPVSESMLVRLRTQCDLRAASYYSSTESESSEWSTVQLNYVDNFWLLKTMNTVSLEESRRYAAAKRTSVHIRVR